MEISETIQTITRLCAWNSRESICKPEHRAIVNSSNKNGSLILQWNESYILFQSSVAYVLNEFCLFELILCVFESCQVGLPGLKQYLEEINVSCSRTQTAAVSQVRLEPVTLRSRVKHSTTALPNSNFATMG